MSNEDAAKAEAVETVKQGAESHLSGAETETVEQHLKDGLSGADVDLPDEKVREMAQEIHSEKDAQIEG
ncbi:hypothetical protein [Mobilicoccus pelagius]|uniref:Uncharacterized protein n=1 Tax=Mobilicoccus pelagius NBRC 104925 TaxID=1089455 RepID=H5UND0_9MICO|nr:hypothetical protein [Mobilicoccus pelagius]GAB47238.1 hypothetical protein MOPEL_007_00540 [Mobilicoccus pelagius NBRC 104925]